MPPQKSIANAQKAALCAQQQLQPDLSNLEIHAWFQQAYNQSISPSSISKILCQLDEQILAQFQPISEGDSNSNEEEEVLPYISHLDALMLYKLFIIMGSSSMKAYRRLSRL